MPSYCITVYYISPVYVARQSIPAKHICLWACERVSVSALNDGIGRRGSHSPPDSPRGHHQPGGPLGNEAPHYDPSQGVPIGPGTEQDAEAAYHRLELLSQSIRNELQRDLHIHDSAVLPNFINLPQV